MFMINRLCCNFQPCDAADVQDPAAQEKEDSAHTRSECNNGMCYLKLYFHPESQYLFSSVAWFKDLNELGLWAAFSLFS